MDDSGSSTTNHNHNNNNNNRIWTNEKHLNFLNSLEATFVRTMLIENNNNYSSTRHPRHSYEHDLRLDRYLPDSLESTLDSTTDRPKKSATASADHRRSRRLSLSSSGSTARSQMTQNSNSSHDQVVPQLSIRSNDKQTAAAD